MRNLITLAALAVAGSASAGPTDGERWDMGAVERRGSEVLTTGLTFRRTGPGEWAVEARCQVTDTRTKRWRVRTGRGVAVRSMGLVLVDVPGLGRFVLFEASDEIAANVPGCASGTAIYGTGD
ncbi:hypothetical protein GOFOIKOB_0058 [Methylobacterium tardum]|uniref:Uncharacterized protein n=1 Tax=Methylobacterium tardum TaxID=374432 RepID=A0AA37THX0_9HYPH|nr:hypothetical protein [Methylobacterium tardum]URD36637.1 hypothetical protein M6G65_30635 [Methylobacterium tardum]GJE47039.1 hypothetical protein GOFOIKOB_0058 [Methylobacterium tardum]GLS71588.1 hypothetical protein GCM10007890_36010 [Methylobacterium tardum]